MTSPAGGAATALADGDTQAHRQLTTLSGWRTYVREAPSPPVLLTARQLARLDEAGKSHYDESRLDHHARLLVVATSAVRDVVACGRRLVLLNRHAISARRGLILSGAAGTGKTTAIVQLGKSHELLDRARHPGLAERIPTVYVTVPPVATARMVSVEFARFLGLPVTPRANITDVIEAVCGVLIDARVGTVLVDEIHNLDLTTRSGAEVSDTLKYFSERIPATFIYAGIDVERAGLFSGTRGQQIAGRFNLISTAAFPYDAEWQGLVATLEDTLLLHAHPRGSLARLDRYLHQRTGGMIGSLSHLIRGAAVNAVLTGTEKITKTALDAVDIDHAAESSPPRRTRRTRTAPPPGTS
jgi:hypothetical protein